MGLIDTSASSYERLIRRRPTRRGSLCSANLYSSGGNIFSSGGAIAATASNLVKWNPGHYMLSDFVLTPHNLGVPAADTELDLCGATPNMLGYGLQVSWGTIETSFGVYDFSKLTPFISRLAGYSTPKRFALIVNWCTVANVSASSQGPTTGVWYPAYLTSNISLYGSSPTGDQSGWWTTGSISSGSYSHGACVHRAAVMGRFQALLAAIAAEYGSNPLFEGVMTVETAGTSSNLNTASDWSWSAFNAQVDNCAAAAVASFPTSNVCIGTNYDSDRITQASFIAGVVSSSGRAGVSAPDLFGASAVTNHGLDAGRTWAQNVYAGLQWNGSAWVSGGPTYRGLVPNMQMVQSPELQGNQFQNIGSPFTPTDLCTAANAIGATHLFWTYIASGTGNSASQITAINANPLTNTTKPSTYP